MEDPSAFDEAKPRTYKQEAEARRRQNERKILQLMRIPDQVSFEQALVERFGLKPETPEYAAALAAWHEGIRQLRRP
jgi:hypothetical protein